MLPALGQAHTNSEEQACAAGISPQALVSLQHSTKNALLHSPSGTKISLPSRVSKFPGSWRHQADLLLGGEAWLQVSHWSLTYRAALAPPSCSASRLLWTQHLFHHTNPALGTASHEPQQKPPPLNLNLSLLV